MWPHGKGAHQFRLAVGLAKSALTVGSCQRVCQHLQEASSPLAVLVSNMPYIKHVKDVYNQILLVYSHVKVDIYMEDIDIF